MKKILTVGAALMLTTTAATAGGLDRSGQGIGAIFEDGRYVELGYGYVTPNVTGTVGAGTVSSGNVAPAYGVASFAYKADLDEKVSLAFIIDQPFGAAVDYSNADPDYPLGTNPLSDATSANVDSVSVTVVGRYKLSENLSVHFGPRYLTASGDYMRSAPTQYTSTYESGSSSGYVAGVAYERPEIALRVALTYSSAIDLELDGSDGNLVVRMPESFNLNFQSGVAADTLLFGSVRWAKWTNADITDLEDGNLISYDEDTVSYALGVGRKFSDRFSGALSIGYEAAQGGDTTNLSPTDGNKSIGLGGTYNMDNGIELTGGVRYIMAGDTITELLSAEFTDNSAVAVGLKVAYTY